MTTVVDIPLTAEDRAELAACEQIIEDGLETFYEVGKALLTVRDKRLYRGQAATWQLYLDVRWGFTRQRAQQFMEAVKVVENVSTIAVVQNEAQARELAKHTPELQRAVAQLVVASAPDGRLTAPRIKHAATVMADAIRTGNVTLENGEVKAWQAALTVEEVEAHKRQQEYIRAKVESNHRRTIKLTLPYPVSANRYWRVYNNVVVVSEEAKAYKEAVQLLAYEAQATEPFTGDVKVWLDVYRPQKRGDLDNCSKVLLDSLNGIAYQDDSQIVEIHARRFDDKEHPRVEVKIVEVH